MTALETIAVTAATLLIYRVISHARPPVWASPVLLCAVVIWGVLALVGTDSAHFTRLTRPLGALLPVAVVALGGVIVDQAATIAGRKRAVFGAIFAGSVFGSLAGLGLARALHVPAALQRAFAAKSVSSPFAVLIMDAIGGPAELAAGLVIATGIISAATTPTLLRFARITDPVALGLAAGVSGHVIATASLSRHPQAAAVAALAMAGTGGITAFLLPLAWSWLASP